MKVATVLLNSDPDSMIRKHSGIISVVSKNVITSCSSVYKIIQLSHIHVNEDICNVCHTFTNAPITPRLVKRRYSNGRVLDTVCKNGYKKSGI